MISVPTTTIKVNTLLGTYPILIGAELADINNNLLPYITGAQVLIVSQANIFDLYGAKLIEGLKPQIEQLDICLIADGEHNKNLEQLATIWDELLTNKHNRTSTIIALGGGIVGDMAGFAAASYQRGIKFIQIPTTLLAQVDSSVGGKTGINHAKGKNMIGAFHQPQAVIIDINTLKSLPKNELIAGLAEVIKYGIMADKDLFDWLLNENNMNNLLSCDAKSLQYIIAKSCQIKADIVAKDEKETGVRALLNLGHTFGHAIESYTKYAKYLHGEAVAIGMVMAAKFSLLLNEITESDVSKIIKLLQLAQLPTKPPVDMQVADFMQFMQLDKKNSNKQIRLILLKKIGVGYINDKLSSPDIAKLLQTAINP